MILSNVLLLLTLLSGADCRENYSNLGAEAVFQGGTMSTSGAAVFLIPEVGILGLPMTTSGGVMTTEGIDSSIKISNVLNDVYANKKGGLAIEKLQRRLKEKHAFEIEKSDLVEIVKGLNESLMLCKREEADGDRFDTFMTYGSLMQLIVDVSNGVVKMGDLKVIKNYSSQFDVQ